VAITVKQISRLNLQPADLNWLAEFDDVGVGVRYHETAGKQMKSQRFNGREITHRTVGNASRAI